MRTYSWMARRLPGLSFTSKITLAGLVAVHVPLLAVIAVAVADLGLCPATGKQRHVSRAAARQHLAALYRSKNVRASALLTPFRCSSCSAWHLGHRR